MDTALSHFPSAISHRGRVLLANRRADGIDDVPRGDAVAIEQFVGLTAARNFPNREAPHTDTGQRHRFADRITNAAGGIMILNG
ncbi:MAG: hypothetical protein WD227_04025, partial [Vicinamibacterales bacterium]